MNRQETLKILAKIKAAYPDSYRGVANEDVDLIVSVWKDAFSDYEYSDVNIALFKIIKTNKTTWAPSPGMIIDKIVIKEKYTQQQLEQFRENKK